MITLFAALVVIASSSGPVPHRAEARFSDGAADGSNAINTLALSRDGKLAVVNGPNHVGHVFSLADGRLQTTLRGHKRAIRCAASLPGGRAITGSVDSTLRIWDLSTASTLLTFDGGHRGIVSAVVASPDGKTILSGGNDRGIVVWDAATGKRLRKVEAKRSILNMALSTDGKHVAVSDRYKLSVRQVSNGDLLWERSSVSCAHERAHALTCLQGRRVRMKKPPLRKGGRVTIHSALRHNIYLGQIAWSSDGKTVAVARENGDVILYEASKGEAVGRLSLPQTSGKPERRRYHPLLSVAVAPDGSYVAAGDNLGTVHVWRRGAALPFTRRSGHEGAIRQLDFLKDGRLVSVSADGTGVVWKRM